MNTTLTLPKTYRVEARAETTANTWHAVRNIALLAAAPLIGLVYVVAFPFVGLAMLAWLGFRALPARLRNIILFFAAPFVGLAYALAFPVVGLGMVAWIGARALVK